MDRPARSRPSSPTRREVPRRRRLTARCLAAVVIVAALIVGDVGASGPVNAQSGARPTFSDPQFYTDVPPGAEPGRPWSPYWHIQSLARAGVFEGTDCATGRFCPDSSLTRWQMAVWLMRSLGEDDLEPIDESRFADVDPTRWWAPYVERVAELGISAGCGRDPLRYCPNASVDKGQVATVVSRALDLPDVDSVGFTDLESDYPHAGNVDRVVTFEIMEACNQDPRRFCRRNNVTKARMAQILFRSLDWLQINSIAESSPVPDNIFLTNYNRFSWYIKTQVVDRYGEDQPWLQAAWNVTNTTQFRYITMNATTSVSYGTRNSWGNYPHKATKVMVTRADAIGTPYDKTFVHELAHVYTMSNRVSNTPLAMATAHLYFVELAAGTCPSEEIMADAAIYLVFDPRSTLYWGSCPHLPYKPTDEAVAIVRDAFSGQIPPWFDETFRHADGDLDHEAIWAAVRDSTDHRQKRVVVYMLRNSFGGYCASYQVHEFLKGEVHTLDATQPWIDGGCDNAAATDAGQTVDSEEDVGHITQARIVARKLADGRIEFGLQQRPDDTWGDRQLPRVRFFPTTARVNRWLASSALDVPPGDVRIVARKLASGRIEFGLQQRHDDTWGDRQLPRVRFFPTTARVNRWLASSPLTLTARQRAQRTGPESAGRYSAVAAGGRHSCALRTDGTIECWRGNWGGEADEPPAGRYSAVTAGSSHSCALRTSGTIACWGNNLVGQADAPDGQFTAVSAGGGHSCALRTSGTIACWGNNNYGPDGRYSAVAAGWRHSCGLRTNGTITCWGNNESGQADAPDGQFTAVSAGGGHSCALRTNGTITCWGYNNYGQADAPAGRYSAVAAGLRHSCGLRTNGTITCWGYNKSGQADAPDGQFTAVSAGWRHSCALRTNGTIECWYTEPGQG